MPVTMTFVVFLAVYRCMTSNGGRTTGIFWRGKYSSVRMPLLYNVVALSTALSLPAFHILALLSISIVTM